MAMRPASALPAFGISIHHRAHRYQTRFPRLASAWAFSNSRYWTDRITDSQAHRKKRFTSFPSPAGMSLTKVPLGRNNSVMTSLFPLRESLVVTSLLGTGNSRTYFLRCMHTSILAKYRSRVKIKFENMASN
jgi:hypothetical protein